MNLPTPSVPNGALRVSRSPSWMFMPTPPVRYHRSSNSCAEAAWVTAKPASKAAHSSFLFIMVVAPSNDGRDRQQPNRIANCGVDGRPEAAIDPQGRFGSVKAALTLL